MSQRSQLNGIVQKGRRRAQRSSRARPRETAQGENGTPTKLQRQSKYRPFKHVWWNNSVIPALGRLRQDDFGIETRVGHVARLCLKSKQINSTLNLETHTGLPTISPSLSLHFCRFVSKRGSLSKLCLLPDQAHALLFVGAVASFGASVLPTSLSLLRWVKHWGCYFLQMSQSLNPDSIHPATLRRLFSCNQGNH